MKLSTLFLAYDRALVGKGEYAYLRRGYFERKGIQGNYSGFDGTYFIATDSDHYACKWQRCDRQAKSLRTRILARLVELEGEPLTKISVYFR